MKNIIIDADTGVDDSLAILYALRSPNFHVEGITTCFGNNNAEQSADNCLRLIKLSNCGYEVPVAVGANESLEGVFESAPAYIHGDNGIGNVILPESSQKPVAESAEDFIIRKADELDGELIVITTGRMTNLAKAYLKDKNRSPAKIPSVKALRAAPAPVKSDIPGVFYTHIVKLLGLRSIFLTAVRAYPAHKPLGYYPPHGRGCKVVFNTYIFKSVKG